MFLNVGRQCTIYIIQYSYTTNKNNKFCLHDQILDKKNIPKTLNKANSIFTIPFFFFFFLFCKKFPNETFNSKQTIVSLMDNASPMCNLLLGPP